MRHLAHSDLRASTGEGTRSRRNLAMTVLDTTITTLAQTGKDMSLKYKETSEGGLAANLVLC